MAKSSKRHLIFEVQGEKDPKSAGRKGYAHHLRLNLQPTTTMMMVAVVMIFYAHVVGG